MRYSVLCGLVTCTVSGSSESIIGCGVQSGSIVLQ